MFFLLYWVKLEFIFKKKKEINIYIISVCYLFTKNVFSCTLKREKWNWHLMQINIDFCNNTNNWKSSLGQEVYIMSYGSPHV